MKKYSQYAGTFVCTTCNEKVDNARFFYDTFDFVWMCSSKHYSKVNLDAKGY